MVVKARRKMSITSYLYNCITCIPVYTGIAVQLYVLKWHYRSDASSDPSNHIIVIWISSITLEFRFRWWKWSLSNIKYYKWQDVVALLLCSNNVTLVSRRTVEKSVRPVFVQPVFVQPVLVQRFSSNPVFVHLVFVHGLFSSNLF